MSEELWTEVHNTVQEAVTKTIPKKKKCKKAQCLCEEALQIAEERREVKSMGGEKERYTQLSADFQRTVRRDQKAFSNEQWKKLEENNRIGKTKDLFKKTGDIKGTFHTRMGMIKDRNGKDLTEQTKKRWQEYTEELYKKWPLMTQITAMVCGLSPRTRHPAMWSQVPLRKHHYKQS